MAADPSLAIRVVANNAELKKVMKESQGIIATTEAAVEKLGRSLNGEQLTKRAATIAEALKNLSAQGLRPSTADAEKMLRTIDKTILHLQQMGKGVPDQLRQTQQALKAVADQGERTGGAMGALRSSFGSMLAAFSAANLIERGVSSLISFGREALASGGRIQDMSNKLGVSMTAVQQWTFAAKQTGSSMDDIGRAVVQMNDRLANGEQSTVKALDAVGLRFRDIRAMRPEEAFNQIVSALGNIADPMTRTQLALDLFGKSGQLILPAIAEGFAKIGEAAPLMSDRTVKALDRAQDRWDKFKDQLTVVTGTVIGFYQDIDAAAEQRTEAVRSAIRRIGMPGAAPKLPTAASGLLPAVPEIKDAAAALSAFDAQLGKTLTQQIASTDASTKAADAAKQHRARIDDLKASMLGLSKASRDQAQALSELISEGKTWVATSLIPIADRTKGIITDNGLLTKTVLAVGESYRTAAERVKAMYYEMGRIADWKTIFSGAMGVAQLSQGFGPSGPSLRDQVRNQLQSAASAFPTMLSNAILHGQSIAQALRATVTNIGGDLGKTWGESLAKSGSKLSGALGSLFSAGAAIGLDFLMKGVGALIAKFKNVTKEGREGLASQLGFDSLADLYKKLQAMGPEGQRLAHLGLNVIGKQDKAANEKWMKDVQAFFAKQTADADRLTAAMEKYGFSWEQLGQKARNAKVKDIADDLFETLRVLTDPALGGIATDEVLKRMAGDFSAMTQQAKRSGTEIPAALRPTLEKLREMGLLIDDTGQLMSLDDVSWAKSMTEGFASVVDAIYDLTAALTGVPRALGPTMDALGGFGGGVTGRGVSGHEAPLLGAGGAINITVVSQLDGREVARNQARWLPEEYRYLQLA